MLPSGHRMRRRGEFTEAVRRGRRAGRHNLVVHLLCRTDTPSRPPLEQAARPSRSSQQVQPGQQTQRERHERAGRLDQPDRQWIPGSGAGDAAQPRALIGFIVARHVGNAVVRNKVRRRLRHLVAGHLDRLPRGSLLVVRAKPGAATARHDELAADLESALGRLLRPRSKGQ